MSDRPIPFVNFNRDLFPKKQSGIAEVHERCLSLDSCSKLRKARAAAAAAETHLHPQKPVSRYRYPTTDRTLGNFRLHVPEGEITDSQIIVVLGMKGTGKTTFLHILSTTLKKLDEGEISNGEMPNVSIKPQLLFPKNGSSQTVRYILLHRIHDSYMNREFVRNVMEPLHIDLLLNKLVTDLSYGEAQRVGLCVCLGTQLDNPEQRDRVKLYLYYRKLVDITEPGEQNAVGSSSY